MQKIKRIIFSEWGFFFIVLLIATAISIYPTLYEYFRRSKIPPDRSFELVYGFVWDFHVYLSKMLQGAQGGWLVFERYTSEIHNPSLLQIFYLFLGKIGCWFSFSTITSYHIFRVVFGLLWFLAGFLFIKISFPNRPLLRKLAFLLFVFCGNFPKLVNDPNSYGFLFLGQKFELHMSGWTHLFPSDRVTFVPHWNAGHLFTALTLLCLFKWYRLFSSGSRKSWIWGITAGACGLLSGFILPPTLIISLVIFGLFSIKINIDCLLQKRNLKQFYLSYLSVLPFWVLSAIPLIYNLWVTSFYPWKALVEGDMYITRMQFPYVEYLWGLGVTSVLGILGMILAFLIKKERLIFSGLWVFGSFLLIIVFDKLIVWHNQTRFVQVGIELPLAILTVFFLDSLFSSFKRFRDLLLIISTIILLLPSVLSWVIVIKGNNDFVDQKMNGTYPSISMGPYVVYPSSDVMKAIEYLDKNMDTNSVSFSGPAFGNYLGAYSNKTSYIGHGAQTVSYYNEKYPTTERFYKGQISEEEIINVFKKHRVGFIIYGPEEKGFGEAVLKYKFLKPVFKSNEITIYKY